jgi:hypothetical protein
VNSSLNFTYDTTFKCVDGNSKVDAKLVGGNRFECKLEKSFTNQYIANISIVAVSKVKGTELLLSKNPIEFYFLSLILIFNFFRQN